MSFLTPLYILGALAIAAPIVFHLIRRTPRGQIPFSSLMFLTATPPRITRRSRLDNILLLLLRAAALALLALAFARPFLREAASLSFGDTERRRVVILVDTSASMRRGDLWDRAKALADRAIADLRPGDQVAVLAFDSSTRPLMGFAESATLDPSRRQAVARAGLDRLEPTYRSTNLGQALVDAIGAIEDAADASEKLGRMPRRVVLVSDLQQGAGLDALGDFEWPSDVELDLKTVTSGAPNAGPQWLPDLEATPTDAAPSPRVRVASDPGAKSEAFTLAWVDAQGKDLAAPTPVYVPPGESRVVAVPRPPSGRTLLLRGDAHPFDNTLYLAASPKGEASVLYVGNDAPDDPNGLLYYLGRVFEDSPARTVRVGSKRPGEPIDPSLDRSLRLVVLASETSPEVAARLKAFAQSGGTVLMVPTSPGPSPTLAALADSPPMEIGESASGRDAMLGEIDFGHPLFAPLAGAQFNDFTHVRFWKHRRIDDGAIVDGRVLARFEGGDPALIEKSTGRGRVVVLSSGWGPLDSQLARSSKFVPLMASMLEAGEPPSIDASGVKVGDVVPLPTDRGGPGGVKTPLSLTLPHQGGGDQKEADGNRGGPASSSLPTGGGGSQNLPDTPASSLPPGGGGPGRGGERPAKLTVRKPDGSTVAIPAGSTEFTETDRPGLYQILSEGEPRAFAVNLDPMESRTAPIAVETLEQLGCKLASPTREVVDQDHLRQMQNAELEGRQKIWRGLILAAIGILIVETWLAGRLGRPRAEALAT
ncbi:BatA domain-containing protein [Tundrisphaera lichenicola]|uniref:vWA domain-containing protein n=1 Tax=Tundrisphaera lichenicola TaxID=2029860 RepID=UPI003EC0C700